MPKARPKEGVKSALRSFERRAARRSTGAARKTSGNTALPSLRKLKSKARKGRGNKGGRRRVLPATTSVPQSRRRPRPRSNYSGKTEGLALFQRLGTSGRVQSAASQTITADSRYTYHAVRAPALDNSGLLQADASMRQKLRSEWESLSDKARQSQSSCLGRAVFGSLLSHWCLLRTRTGLLFASSFAVCVSFCFFPSRGRR